MSMPVIKPGTVTLHQAISDIIESVALEQTGLSHILNAEGEKIQKIIANGTIDQMLAVNQSVQGMIKAISNLEMILQSKLELFSCQNCAELLEDSNTVVRAGKATPISEEFSTIFSKEDF